MFTSAFVRPACMDRSLGGGVADSSPASSVAPDAGTDTAAATGRGGSQAAATTQSDRVVHRHLLEALFVAMLCKTVPATAPAFRCAFCPPRAPAHQPQQLNRAVTTTAAIAAGAGWCASEMRSGRCPPTPARTSRVRVGVVSRLQQRCNWPGCRYPGRRECKARCQECRRHAPRRRRADGWRGRSAWRNQDRSSRRRDCLLQIELESIIHSASGEPGSSSGRLPPAPPASPPFRHGETHHHVLDHGCRVSPTSAPPRGQPAPLRRPRVKSRSRDRRRRDRSLPATGRAFRGLRPRRRACAWAAAATGCHRDPAILAEQRKCTNCSNRLDRGACPAIDIGRRTAAKPPDGDSSHYRVICSIIAQKRKTSVTEVLVSHST